MDVAAKATSADDGESSVMKCERVAISEMEDLLAEMSDGYASVEPVG